ncbi:hypothetical protein T459_34956 [Capsicum annuum]|uniref:Uncharacterized protein n=1 Tax=Capsicum annuum TaxID=4072 RepID=A0A2G2XV51_CAPAN|nr:hypothetical protein T459_34956 [Capsicum annuum]
MSPGRHAATRSCCGSSSCNTPTTNGFGTRTPVPSLQSQSSSRSYRSILPTFLAYIIPSTRGCSPWRPDAVKSAIGSGWNSVLHIFKGRRESIGHHAACGALPASGPYLWLSRFQNLHRRPLCPGSRLRFCSDHHALLLIEAWNLSQRPGVGRALKSHPFLGLVDSEVLLTKNVPLGALDSVVCSHLNPSQKIKVGRRCTPQRDPTNQIPCALWVYSTVYPHTSQTPWFVFQDGLNGEPTSQRSKCAVADLSSRLEHLRAVGSGFPNARRAVAVTAKRVKLEPPLDVTSIDTDSYLGQPRARGV